jgi:hypothetical protein
MLMFCRTTGSCLPVCCSEPVITIGFRFHGVGPGVGPRLTTMQLKKLLEKWDLTSLKITTPFLEMLFPLTRGTIKRNGGHSINFTPIVVVVLNQKVRPFTAKWHPRVLDAAARQQFRAKLRALQTDLRNYTRLLTEMADVEDLTDLESV